MREAEVWRAVAGDLRRVMDSLRSSRDRAFHAPLHLRIGRIRLQAALLEEAASIVPRLAAEANAAPDGLSKLAESLSVQLSGRQAERAVLEALPPSVRVAATADVTAALQSDPGYEPALQAAAALAVVSGRWPEAVAWYERLARHAKEAETAGMALVSMGDIHWRKLGRLEAARDCYLEARAVVGDDPVLLDKLLKLELELERWPAAIETCRRLLQLLREGGGRAEAAVTYLLTLGEIHLYGLEDAAGALDHYLEAIAGAPAYDLAYTLLQELLESGDRAKILAALGEGEGERARLGGMVRGALEAHAGDVPGAVADFRRSVRS
jgi:tetratricopeptide (TPR) repeat protein